MASTPQFLQVKVLGIVYLLPEPMISSLSMLFRLLDEFCITTKFPYIPTDCFMKSWPGSIETTVNPGGLADGTAVDCWVFCFFVSLFCYFHDSNLLTLIRQYSFDLHCSSCIVASIYCCIVASIYCCIVAVVSSFLSSIDCCIVVSSFLLLVDCCIAVLSFRILRLSHWIIYNLISCKKHTSITSMRSRDDGLIAWLTHIFSQYHVLKVKHRRQNRAY